MSTSHYSSRPAQSDIGRDTIRIPLDSVPRNTRRTPTAATLWLIVGCIVLCCDALAMRVFAEDAVEAVIIGILTMPLGILTIVAAIHARRA